MKRVFIASFVMMAILLNCAAQQSDFISIHQEQLEYYNSLGIPEENYFDINKPDVIAGEKNTSSCNLNKIVFGWHPYWSNGLEANYDWSLLSDLSFFSYEVVASTGEASTTHGWETSSVVTEALNNGVRVNLCVTLFSSHSTFFASSTAQQTLISNLISLVQLRNANGVNIDFEGVSSSLKTQFSNFLIDLCTQMHAAIPGSQVSVCTYAVDWSDLFDEAAIDPYIDLYTIMGYAYYYSGSSTAGPTAPLYTFASYNYNLSRTINYYISQGASKSKLVLGLPYYGHEWNTTSSTVPSSTTSSVSSRTYKYVKANSTGNYSTRLWDANSLTPYYVYYSSNWRQCFCDDEISLSYRYDMVNMQDIAGIGIWALGYDDGYIELWNLLREKFTDCGTVPCSDTIYDMGGPNRVYWNNDDYTFTIAPTGASKVVLDFIEFDIEPGSASECNYDYIEIFDGPDVNAPSFGKFCNTNGSPGTITSTGTSLTVSFHSDISTVNNGYTAIWTCISDNEPPVTSVLAPNWATSDFTAEFTDSDNDQVDLKFYQVLDWDGTEWRANTDFGVFNDNFQDAINNEWSNLSGDWTINSQHLNQTNEDSSNTNLFIPVQQIAGNTYLYHWQMSIGGSGANRRAGLHFFCSDTIMDQRGDSYMVYFRVDQDKCQLYKSTGNAITIQTDDACIIDPNVWYDYKIIHNTVTGEIKAYQNNVLVSSWTDPVPLTSGSFLSLRTGNCNVLYDDLKIYKNRDASEIVTVGPAAEVRYQNTDPAIASCRIKSIITDINGNFSDVSGTEVNVDWTAPVLGIIRDGYSSDIDTTFNPGQLSSNWDNGLDPHSGLLDYSYCIGTQPGDSNIIAWTNCGIDNTITHGALSLTPGTTYYFSVYARNNAGLFSAVIISDGQLLLDSIIDPVAAFELIDSIVCENSMVTFTNLSENGENYLWTFPGGTPDASAEFEPYVIFSQGSHLVQLIVTNQNGADTLSKYVNIQLLPLPVANFAASDTLIELGNPVYFTNQSQNANTYLWNLGDGTTTTDFSPWHLYAAAGYYDIQLQATNDCGTDTLSQAGYIHIVNISSSNLLSGSQDILIYPNPSTGIFNISEIDTEKIQDSKIAIFNITGKKIDISLIKSRTQEYTIDVNFLPAGIYILQIGNENFKVQILR